MAISIMLPFFEVSSEPEILKYLQKNRELVAGKILYAFLYALVINAVVVFSFDLFVFHTPIGLRTAINCLVSSWVMGYFIHYISKTGKKEK